MEGCRSYPQFPRALTTCLTRCDDVFFTSAGCKRKFGECSDGCQGGATTTTTSTSTTATTSTTTTTVP